jgi:hypothetical protein
MGMCLAAFVPGVRRLGKGLRCLGGSGLGWQVGLSLGSVMATLGFGSLCVSMG